MTFDKLVQSKNALSEISVTPFSIVTLARFLHPLKTNIFIYDMLDGITISFIFSQPEKAPPSIDFTLFGRVTSTKLVQSVKALSPIYTTVFGIFTL